MKKQLLILPFVIFFFIILVFFYLLISGHNPSKLPSALIGKKVPNFESQLLLNDKKFISNKEFVDEITIVNFFATWCKPCREEHFYIEKLSNKKGIKIVGINYKDKPQHTIKWLEELGNPYSSIVIDLNGSIGIDWGVYGIPETFVVNQEGIIKHRHVGPITKKIYDSFYSKIEANQK